MGRTPCPGCSGTWSGSAATRWPCARSISASGARSPGASTASARSTSGSGSSRWASGRGTWYPSSPRTVPSGCTRTSAPCPSAASTNGIYTTDSAKQIEYIVNDSGSRFFCAENEEQLDKILEVRARCPQLVKIIVFDMEGLHGFTDEQVMPFDELLDLGERYDREASGRVRSDGRDREAGRPRHSRLHLRHHGAAQGRHAEPPQHPVPAGLLGLHHEPREGDQQLSFLPLAHIAERTFSVFYPLHSGATVNFAENIDTVPANVREVAPRRLLRRASDLGEVLLRRRAAHARGHLRGTARLRVGDLGGNPHGRGEDRGPEADGWASGCSIASRTSSCSTTSGARSGCTGSGAPPRAPRRSRPSWSGGTSPLGIDMREVYGQTENCVPRDGHAREQDQARHGGARPPGHRGEAVS